MAAPREAASGAGHNHAGLPHATTPPSLLDPAPHMVLLVGMVRTLIVHTLPAALGDR
jgi:hypothetical protein